MYYLFHFFGNLFFPELAIITYIRLRSAKLLALCLEKEIDSIDERDDAYQ
jgi:hypothetical protein